MSVRTVYQLMIATEAMNTMTPAAIAADRASPMRAPATAPNTAAMNATTVPTMPGVVTKPCRNWFDRGLAANVRMRPDTSSDAPVTKYGSISGASSI